MAKRLSRYEKKRIAELETAGVYVDEVYGTVRSSSLLLCLSKAVIIFLVCSGTVTGFADAFSLNYNKGTILLFTAFVSVLISLLYVRRKFFYIGYVTLLVVFTVELLRYYLYANSGFQAIMNTVREAYADHFDMSVVRNAEETYVNRNVTITIALIFIIIFLVIMYNITISRYMNFAETFGISFIILEIPLYIGYKPPLGSVILVAAGCICTGLLQRGAFNRVTIPGKNAPDYIADRFFGRRYYTTRGSHRGILLAVLFSFVASVVICIVSVPAYNRGLGDTPEDSAKAIVDDNLKILVQNGISGFFNRYDSLNGLNRGALGGVSSVSPDFETDLVVSFVPYGSETIYLPGFKGVTYSGMNWYNRINTAEFPELEITGTQYIDSQTIDSIDYSILGNVFKMKDAVTGVMQISYLDRSFGLEVSPYITYPGSRYIAEDPLYVPEDPEKDRVFGTSQMEYYPIKFAEYLDADDYADNGVTRLNDYVEKLSSYKSEDDLPDSTRATYTDELTNGRMLNYSEEREEYDRLEYKDYVYDVCLKVPYALDRYLDRFVKEHSYFGLRNILNQLKSLTYDLNSMREYGVPVEIKTFDFDGTMVPYYDSVSVIEKGYELKDAINEYRLQVCQAIENMFYEEYPYTLSPGKTPADEDFVQYFLENQKRGYCAHFASAAVMILRHLGIPARYVEGYCIPHSLMKEYSVKLEDKQEGWLSLEDNIYNPENAVYQVEVSDYYAHAWVEVYLEGKGFVPYEFTPPSFEAIPEGGGAMSDIGKFFSRLMNVDLGIGNPKEESISVIGETEHVVEEVSGIDLDVVFRPLVIVIAVSVIFWMLFLLIRKIIREIRFAGYLKEENYRPLVYGRYQEFVNRLKRKKIVKEKNPLPMELSHILAEYSEVREDEYEAVFKYVEKVLYSSETTDKNEYLSFYGFIRNFRYRKKNT